MKTNRLLSIIAVILFAPLLAKSSNINNEYLYGYTWCEVDDKSGDKLNSELFFDKDGLVLCCTIGDNPEHFLPEWNLCKYTISENSLSIVKNKKEESDYNIIKLSKDTLVLKSNDKIRLFKTQSSLINEMLSHSNNTTINYLTAKQWQMVKPPKYLSKWNRWYFSENKWIVADFRYNNIKDEWETIIEIREYYLADWADHNFSRSQLSKKRDNGSFINYYIEHKLQGQHNKYKIESILPKIQSMSYKIVHSSDGYLLLESVAIDYHNDNIYNNGETHSCFLQCL